MSPRTGRPKKEISRDKDINIRLSQQELDEIQFVADSLNTTRTNAIVEGIKLLKTQITKKTK